MSARSTYFSFFMATCLNGGGFLPDNDLKIPVSDKNEGGLTFKEYNSAIDRVQKVYNPLLRNMVIKRLWSSDTVNAGTYVDDETGNRVINMYGGMARHPLMTEDGLSLVLCHEIGHHLGGAPRKTNSNGYWIWAATEGQSDYFATLKCMRKVFAKEDNKKAINLSIVPEKVKSECRRSFKNWQADLCIRTSMAGLVVANVMADTSKLPDTSFETPDNNVTDLTLEFHPNPQCRLDTYLQGSICKVSDFYSTSQTNEVYGTCHELNGYKYGDGNRPVCWYKPQK